MNDADKKKNAQLYFLDLFKSYIRNYNKVFSKKYSPSIRELLCDYIELYNDIATSPENQKLRNSLKSQLDVMKFFIDNSILNKSILKVNLDILKNKIQKVNSASNDKDNDDKHKSSEYFAILKLCSALLKSMDKINIYDLIISIVFSTKNFIEIDSCTECLSN